MNNLAKSIRNSARGLRRQVSYPYKPFMDSKKCIFIHVPKTGGSSIRKALGAARTGRQHLPWSVYYQANPAKFNRYFKFGFVRNPTDRALSSYYYLKRGGNGREDSSASEAISKFESFSDFVINGLAYGYFSNHILFLPQTFFLCDWAGQPQVDFMGRVESFAADSNEILKRLGIEAAVSHQNKAPNGSEAPTITASADSALRLIYANDFRYFDY